MDDDTKTGYPLTITDAEAHANGTPGTTLGYQTSLNGFVADLIEKVSPEGRKWAFGYDTLGNLTSVVDPAGTATPTVGDFTTIYAYDAFGQLLTATDANGHATSYSAYDPTGFPKTITDALTNPTAFVYDARGNVTSVTDARGKTSTYGYDVFGRSGESRVPKDQAAGQFVVTPAPVYDGNDNVTTATAPNGAVTTYSYDAMDRPSTTLLPKDTPTGPERRVAYTYDNVGNLATVTEPNGSLTGTDPDDFVTRYAYDPIDQLTSVTNADGDVITYSYDSVGNLVKVVDPRKSETADPDDFTTTYTYDRAHRPKTATDAAGHVQATAYDRDGLVRSVTDRQGATTEYVLDARGLVAEVRVPHVDNGGTITYRVTKYEYDQVGNQTKVVTPRGVETTGDAADFVYQTVYDELNRVREQLLPFDPDDPRYNTADKTTSAYDAVGNLTKVSAPPSEGQSVRNDTSYAHFDNGWIRTSTDPWDIVAAYDYNPLGQQTARTLTSAGGSSSRTMSWTYTPDGKLASRSDDGVPVGRHVVLVDNSDTQNVATTGSWPASAAGSGFQGHNYQTNAAGTGTDSFTWRLTIPQDGTYEVFVRYPAVAGAASNAPFNVTHAGGSTAVTVNQTIGAGTWVSLGSFAFTEAGAAQAVKVTDQASGTVVADAVKLVRDNAGETDTEGKTFTYAYDANGNLTGLTDGSSGALVDQYVVGYDGLNRVSSVQEKNGSTVKATTAYTYDANGNPLTRDHDDQDASYTWDTRDLLSTVAVTEPGAAAKVTGFTYTPNGWVSRETKANGNTVDHTYFLDGLLKTQTEKKASGTLVAEHLLAYNGNGHKTSDTSRVMDADDHASYLDVTTAYTYDPRDRVASVSKTDTSSGGSLSSEAYTHDANSNVVAQTLDGTSTSFVYDRNRLLSSTSGGVSSGFNYDPFGRLDTVTAAGQVLQSYRYDGFDRVVKHTTSEPGSTTTTAYTYDPLDRTASRTEDAGAAGEETTAFAYLGLSDQLVTEQIGGQLQRSYQYSPFGQRLSQVTLDGASREDSFYGYTPHTDVETLTSGTGDTRATYAYTAYGKDDTGGFTGVDVPDPANPDQQPYNLYRYTAKRWDPASGDYDMGFRHYNPGLNRFLSRDTYTGALADLNLAVSPWTGNRYAFTGGNPITGIEHDGHAYESGGAGATWTAPGYCATATCAQTTTGHSTPPRSPLADSFTPDNGGGGLVDTVLGGLGELGGGLRDYGAGAIGGVVGAVDSVVPGPNDLAALGGTFSGGHQVYAQNAPSYTDAYRSLARDLGVNTSSATYATAEIIGVPSLAGLTKIVTKLSARLAANAGRGTLNLPFKDPALRSQVDDVVRHFDEFGAPPPGVAQGGLKGYPNGTYGGQGLPQKPLGYYTESDVWASGGGIKRGAERLVFGGRGEVYYTPTHYDYFVRIR